MNWRWPTALATTGIAWYASESLRHRREGGRGYELCGDDPHVGSPGFIRATEAVTGAPVSSGSELELLINGDAIFPAFLKAIAEAQHSLNLVTYVYWKGEIAEQVAAALSERARAGVAVHLLLDAMGTVQMDRGLISDMEDAGVRVVRFRPPKPYAVRRLNNRTHRKLLVADGRVGLIGGVGIAEEWTGNAEDPEHWRDTHLLVRGPVVRGLQGAFAENWLEATGDVLVGDDQLPDLAADGNGDTAATQIVRSSAGVGDTNVETLFYLAIACARDTLDLTSAYFAPRPAFIAALCDAADRGVRVRILVPGEHIDKGFVRVAGRGAYDKLLGCGVRVWEYGPTMLHAKTMTVDGGWATVGSVNFDNRSFQLHDEVTLCVQSEQFTGLLEAQFERDLDVSEEITEQRWRDRTLRQRVHERVLTLARREL